MSLQVKVTPTFMLFRGCTADGAPDCVHSLTGINEGNLRRAVVDHLRPGEAGSQPPESESEASEPAGSSP